MRFRDATLADYDGVAAMLHRVGLWMPSREDAQHRWGANPFKPAGSPSGADTRIGWLMEADGGRVVGYCGNVFSGYELDGQPLLAASAQSLGVDPDYRTQSLPLLVRFFRQPGVQLLLSTTANEKAGQVYSGFKAVRVPHPNYDRVMYWAARPSRLAAAGLRSKRIFAADALGAVLAPGLWLADFKRRAKLRVALPKGVSEPRPVTEFDDRFEAFWQRIRQQPGRLIAVRSKAALDWHYHEARRAGHLVVLALEEGDGLAGYLTMFRRDAPAIGLKRYEVVDLQLSREEPSFVPALIGKAVHVARRHGVDIVEAHGFDAFKNGALAALSPRVRRYPSFPYFYKAQTPDLAKKLESPDVWDPCPYDGDAGF